MMRVARALLLLLVAMPLVAADAKKEVRAVLDQWLSALAKNDFTTVQRIVADDYVITAGGEGKVMDKTEDLAPLQSGEVKFTSAEASDVDIRIFGDTAIVTGLGRYVVVMPDGKSAEFRERFTDVYARRKGRWQPVASHTTPVKTKK